MPDAGSLYDVLLVEQTATLDEIKLAFKRRALQVHPDKGGSKEAFHSVYQALETLSDPEARRKYDAAMTGKRPAGAEEQPAESQERKPSKKDVCHRRATNKKAQPAAGKVPKQKKTGHVRREPTRPEAFQSKQSKLLTRIRDLLKKLPRAERNDVIADQFSQKQRLILEKWMVDAQRESPAQGEGGEVGKFASAEASCEMVEQGETEQPERFSRGNGRALALLAVPRIPSRNMIMQASGPCQPRKKKTKKNKKSEAKPRSNSGGIRKNGCSYVAQTCFDTLELSTRSCDLQTALEYLVVLTAVKQKMQGSEPTTGSSLEERLQVALESSACEHGKNIADLRLSFAVLINAVGLSINSFRTPRVHSLEKLARIRRIFEPVRQRLQINTGGRSIYWWVSPADLQATWSLYQQAVADAWGVTGADSTAFLNKIRASYTAKSEFRNTQLQRWERARMAMQDRNKHRPRNLRARPREQWERQQMALEDARRDKHGPKKKRLHSLRPIGRAKPSPLFVLKRLLKRWGHILKMEAQLLDKERRRVVRQKNAQRKKDQEEARKQRQVLKRKCVQEERLRRESLRKRMKSDLTMEDMLGASGSRWTSADKNNIGFFL